MAAVGSQKKPQKNPRKVNSILALCKALGCARDTARRLVDEEGLELDPKTGEYDLEKANELLDLRKTRTTGKLTKTPEQKAAYERFWMARATEKEIDLAIKAGRFIDTHKVVKDMIERELEFKRAFQQLPEILGPILVGRGAREITAIIRQRVAEIFRELVRKGSQELKDHGFTR